MKYQKQPSIRKQKIMFYDKMSGERLNLKIVKNRLKVGLKITIGVFMNYETYEKLQEKEHNRQKHEAVKLSKLER